jgi:hypothetical protein
VLDAYASALTKDQLALQSNYNNTPFAHITFGIAAFEHRSLYAEKTRAAGFLVNMDVFERHIQTAQQEQRLPANRPRPATMPQPALPARAAPPGGAKLRTSGESTVAGTIIHELSHHICNTADEDDTYGAGPCQALARGNAESVRKACNNADNYLYYCETFQQIH